jgi:ankyrin repeat protein
MERITAQKPGFRKLAESVLLWITHTSRPLTTQELRHGLAVEIGAAKLDEKNFPEVEDMASVCAGLVTIDKESNVIRLVHHTTQEYLEQNERWFPEAEKSLATSCVTYLSFSYFEGGFCPTDEEFEKRLQQYPLYSYAARNWGGHAQRAPTKAQELILSFLKSEAKVSASSQAMLASRLFTGDSGYTQRVSKQMTGAHLAAYFGLENAMVSLRSVYDLDGRDSYGRTPLSLAAENGHEDVVSVLLLNDSVNINNKDIRYLRTPLSWAAGNGHYGVVKLLLAKSEVEPDSKDSGGRTPLSWAAANGHDSVVKFLLTKDGVASDSKATWYYKGRTPLSWAAANGHRAVVELLLRTERVDPDSKDDDGRTPLSYMAEYGYETLVKLLLTTDKVDPDSKDSHNRTPLSWAAENGHEAVVKLLIEKGADLEYRDTKTRQTPLLRAAENGHEAVVKLLIEKGANLEYRDTKHGQTPLLWAAENGHEAVMKLLIKKCANLESQTPPSWAAENGHKAVVTFNADHPQSQSESFQGISNEPTSPDWEEFYKNGIPKEIIIIDDDSPPPKPPPRTASRRGGKAAAAGSTQSMAGRKRKVGQGYEDVTIGQKRKRTQPQATTRAQTSSEISHATYTISNQILGRAWDDIPTGNTDADPFSFNDEAYVTTPGLSVVRAHITILQHMHSYCSKVDVWDPFSVSPFYQSGTPSASPPPLAVALPDNYHPTALQKAVKHHPVLDLLPWPSVRSKILQILTLPQEFRPQRARGDMASVTMQLMFDIKDAGGGLRVWGSNPFDEDNWEVGPVFFQKWWWALNSEIVKRSNQIRTQRGEGALRFKDVSN